MSTSLRKYRHIEQSRGELHVLPLRIGLEDVHAVGTSGCRTCMCVYVRMDDDRVFIAHMVAHSLRPSPQSTANIGTCYDKWESQWTSDMNRGYRLKRKVLAQLHARLPPGLRARATDPTYANDSTNAFAVCPAIYLEGKISNGWWMREAVQEFFELENGIPVHWAHGFVAGPGVDTVFFRWGDEAVADADWEQRRSLEAGDEDELNPGAYRWVDCGGHQGQDMLFGFIFDGAKWHKWENWRSPP